MSLTVISAIVLDRLAGEPRRFHPLVGFGNLASLIEKKLNTNARSKNSILRGFIALLILIIPFASLSLLLNQQLPTLVWLIDIVVLYWALGHQSLREHIFAVERDLRQHTLTDAKQSLAMIVSRDTQSLNEQQVTQATIETCLENGSDAIFAPIFWFLLLGTPGVILYRLCNTLDAMWGYRNDRYNYFGRAAARCDDLLNYVPARLVSLSYAILGKTRQALKCWFTQAPLLNSPNAGPVMCAGAGSLGLLLGGTAYYHGKRLEKAEFGCGRVPNVDDIRRSTTLILQTLFLWCSVTLTIELVTSII